MQARILVARDPDGRWLVKCELPRAFVRKFDGSETVLDEALDWRWGEPHLGSKMHERVVTFSTAAEAKRAAERLSNQLQRLRLARYRGVISETMVPLYDNSADDGAPF